MRAPSLRILNSELELVADIERYGELYYTRSLAEPGDFAFLLPSRQTKRRPSAEATSSL